MSGPVRRCPIAPFGMTCAICRRDRTPLELVIYTSNSEWFCTYLLCDRCGARRKRAHRIAERRLERWRARWLAAGRPDSWTKENLSCSTSPPAAT